jgi:AcrR family transcriptional regulator
MRDAREQLFEAAERVLAREGATGLTSRAITDEAGVAKGLIYRYFTDLDEFLAELTATWVRAAVGAVSDFPERAGHGSIRDNLCATLLTLFGPGSHVPMVTVMVASRPALMLRLHRAVQEGMFGRVEESFAAYLEAERLLGRLRSGADTQAAAIVLLGAAHHLVFTGRATAARFPDEIGCIVETVLTGLE